MDMTDPLSTLMDFRQRLKETLGSRESQRGKLILLPKSDSHKDTDDIKRNNRENVFMRLRNITHKKKNN